MRTARRLLPPSGPSVSRSAGVFPPEPFSAVRARRFVREHLAAQQLDADAAEHVTSELVANVAEHARTPVRVEIFVGATVRIEVHDGSAVEPAIADAALDAERGRGLAIVEALAREWGMARTPGGKMIWVELDRDLAG